MDELAACALLARALHGSPVSVRAAMRRHGSARAAIAAADLPARLRKALDRVDGERVDRDLEWLAATGTRLIPWSAASYPEQLAQVAGAPAFLYVRGEAQALCAPQIAIVGARAASAAGRATAGELAAQLCRSGLAITSGLAIGIDAAAHEGALASGGVTIGVCAHGLDLIYPREHAELATRIAASGALVSELPPGSRPEPWRFARRNRLVSGLALGTLVVEARCDSGSLITAAWAQRQSRPVLAVPGSIRHPGSAGCHALLRKGAALVECAADVLAVLKFNVNPQPLAAANRDAAGTVAAARRLDKLSEMLLDALGFEPASIDELVERTALPSGHIASMLLNLELEGRVAPHPGGRYCRLS